MFAAYLVLLVPALAFGELPFDVPPQCSNECVTKYKGGDQSACIRGCSIAYVTQSLHGPNYPTCEEACDHEFNKSFEYAVACKKSCGMFPTSVQDSKPTSILDWIRNSFMSAISKFSNGISSLRGTDSGTTTKATETAKKDTEEHPFFITRVRIFQRIIPDEALNAANVMPMMMNPMMPMHHMMLPTHMKDQSEPEVESDHEPQEPSHQNLRLMWSVRDTKPDHPMMHYMFKHVIISPLILSLFVVLILLVSLVTIKMIVQACYYRDTRRVQYSRLPTYIEAVNVKIPYTEDDQFVEKKKLPEDA